VFTKIVGDKFIAMSVHVVYFYAFSNNNDMLSTLYKELTKQSCNVTRKAGDTLEYIGMSVQKLNEGSMKIYQPTYTDKILETSEMFDCNEAPTPYANVQTSLHDDGESVDKTQYLS